MQIQHRTSQIYGHSSSFNLSSIDEVIIYYDDGSVDSDSINNLDVWISTYNSWIPLQQAFRARLVIPNNYNTHFREPRTTEEMERGWCD